MYRTYHKQAAKWVEVGRLKYAAFVTTSWLCREQVFRKQVWFNCTRFVPDGHKMALVQLYSFTKSCPKSKDAKDDPME